jgi:hypothetical protein
MWKYFKTTVCLNYETKGDNGTGLIKCKICVQYSTLKS